MVMRMAKAPDGRDPRSRECLVLESPGPDDNMYANDSLVRAALGDGRCVLLTGYPLDGPCSLLKEEMLAFRGSLQHRVECIGKHDL